MNAIPPVFRLMNDALMEKNNDTYCLSESQHRLHH